MKIWKLQSYCSALEPTKANLRLRAIIALFLFQGLRQIEVVRLNVEDISFRDKVALIRGKGRDDKEPVYLHPSTVKVLREYLRLYRFREGPLFRSDSNHCRGGRLTTKSVREIIKRTFHTLQIDGSAHGFRHYFITKLIKSYKGELLTVSKYSRHRSIQMLEVYNDEVIRQEDLPRYYSVFKDIRIWGNRDTYTAWRVIGIPTRAASKVSARFSIFSTTLPGSDTSTASATRKTSSSNTSGNSRSSGTRITGFCTLRFTANRTAYRSGATSWRYRRLRTFWRAN